MMGLGSMVGTGVFVSIGIAAGVAGPSVLLAIALAALVATCNALSSAQLAASHPVSGADGRRRCGGNALGRDGFGLVFHAFGARWNQALKLGEYRNRFGDARGAGRLHPLRFSECVRNR